MCRSEVLGDARHKAIVLTGATFYRACPVEQDQFSAFVVPLAHSPSLAKVQVALIHNCLKNLRNDICFQIYHSLAQLLERQIILLKALLE